MTTLREETGFNGFLYRMEYNPFGMGCKYRIRYRKPDEYGFRHDTSWATQGEAERYFNKLIKGGM
jgi:hypothetical protein